MYNPAHCYACGKGLGHTHNNVAAGIPASQVTCPDHPTASASGTAAFFCDDACKDEWWHRQDPAPPCHSLPLDSDQRKGTNGRDEIHPNYYQQGGIEVIGIIRAFRLGFNLGNVLKYILRAGLKSDSRLQDLQKANTYLQFELKDEHEKDGNQK